jgi:hypothetical protein
MQKIPQLCGVLTSDQNIEEQIISSTNGKTDNLYAKI